MATLGTIGVPFGREVTLFIGEQTDAQLKDYLEWYSAKVFMRAIHSQPNHIVSEFRRQILEEMKRRGIDVELHSS